MKYSLTPKKMKCPDPDCLVPCLAQYHSILLIVTMPAGILNMLAIYSHQFWAVETGKYADGGQ